MPATNQITDIAPNVRALISELPSNVHKHHGYRSGAYMGVKGPLLYVKKVLTQFI